LGKRANDALPSADDLLTLGCYAQATFVRRTASPLCGQVIKEQEMPILTVFKLATMNARTYDQLVRDLEHTGHGTPKGRLYHTAAAQEDGSFIVTDAWESAELLAEFGKALIPALQKVGVTPVEPAVYPIHNIIEG
jgi:hypothetical protein